MLDIIVFCGGSASEFHQADLCKSKHRDLGKGELSEVFESAKVSSMYIGRQISLLQLDISNEDKCPGNATVAICSRHWSLVFGFLALVNVAPNIFHS